MRVDEHPEALLDQARRGGLAPEQQAILERHLAGCAICAGQLSLASRFERELASQPSDEVVYQRAVEGAVRRTRRSPLVGGMRRLPRWSRWAAAAALLAFGVTGAAAVLRQRMATRPAIPSLTPAVGTPASVPAIRPVASPPPEAPVPPQAPPPKPPPSSHAAAHPPITAAALFERGEKLRREGHVDAAIAAYRQLQATFPETEEARFSFALAGELLLERGRAGDALSQFDRHLSLDGEVGEEALAGRARALEQLHRTSEAVAAWKTLLARYPRSVYAERARARLDQLIEQR